jgi:hypothetical protein
VLSRAHVKPLPAEIWLRVLPDSAPLVVTATGASYVPATLLVALLPSSP